MTAAAIAARRERPAGQPVPWTRLAWVTWRQHRAALAGAAAFLGAIAVYLAYMGREIHHAYASAPACQTAGKLVFVGQCQSAAGPFLSFYGSQRGTVVLSGINAQTVPFLLLAVPVLLGTFTGAPLLARELESGTFRFAWTQSAGRMRLVAARVVPVAVVLTAAAYGLSALFSWYFTPFLRYGLTGRFPMQVFGNLGVDFAAWTLFSFAVASFLGALLRRTTAATATALAVTTVLDIVTMMAVRQHYAASATVTGAGPSGAGDWVLGNWLTTTSGAPVNSGAVFAQLRDLPLNTPASMAAYLARHHYTLWWSYQPASRWWQFQLTEGGWLLAASLLLIAATVLLIRRRPA